MNEPGDTTSRMAAASEAARCALADARSQFGAPPPPAEPPGSAFGRFRAWCRRRLPGGEVTLWTALGILIMVLFVVLIVPSRQRTGFGGGRGGVQPVGVAKAVKGDIDITINALGTVTPLATATVTPQVSGQIVRVTFREGQVVQAGDVLAVIDPRPYQAALDQAKGQLARDQAALANAALTYKRQKALLAAKATAEADYDSAEAAFKQAEATARADKAAVDAAAIKLDFTKLTSPINGRAGLRDVDVGNYVGAGQATGITVVTQVDPMSVLFTIPEDAVDTVMARLSGGAPMRVEAYDRGQTRKIATGRLAAMDSQIDTSTGTVKLRAMFRNDAGVLFPNQFVNVKLLADTLHDQTVVPATAIQRGSQGTFVFVVKSDKTVTMRAVTLGPQDGERIAVTKGLNPGETVVVDGADRLNEGDTVTIPSGAAIAAVAAPADASGVAGAGDPRARRRAMMKKITAAECEKLKGMERADRFAWIMQHRAELMGRKDQAGPQCELGGGRGGPPGGGPPPP
jgi:membrane fusion protein, multidrug efflux system